MMKMQAVLGLALITVMAGCTMVQSPVIGGIYTNTKGAAAVGSGSGTKMGVSCAQGILGVAWGDASIETARANGNITEIATVDYDAMGVLGVWAKSCTIVKGK